MRTLLFSLGLICCMKVLSAGGVVLINDSSFPLFAEIHAADGTVIGRESLKPRERKKWSGGWSTGSVSQTPYVVRWFCEKTGQEFSLCDTVPSGMTVSALSCEGVKYCRPPPKKESEGASSSDQAAAE